MLSIYGKAKIRCEIIIKVFKHGRVHSVRCCDFRSYNCDTCYRLMDEQERCALRDSIWDDTHYIT